MTPEEIKIVLRCLMYKTDARILYAGEGAEGFWKKAEMPAPPTEKV